MKRVLGRILIVLLVLAALAVSVGLWYRQRVSTPYRGFVTDETFVDLPLGAGVAGIANRLAAAGVIPDAWTFRLAARLSGSDRRMKAGEYRFADADSPTSVMARLVAGDVFTRAVTFPEGLTLFEMSEVFGKSGLGSAEAFRLAAADPALVSAWDSQARSLEGYLFPDTYAWPRREDAGDAVRAMVAGFDRAFDATLRADAAARGLTVHDAVTLASIIEKETGSADERALVSAVYHNRLKIGMPLQCDPTVIYALMLAGRWDGNLRKDDLALRSPYNTYLVRGLPPGPIASPGRASLHAAIHPADAKYLYFVSRNDGTHVFAATLAEHNRNVATYQEEGQRAEGKGQREVRGQRSEVRGTVHGVILFDGTCAFCEGSVKFIARRDPGGYFRFGTSQSEQGVALLAAHGLTRDLARSIVLIEDGRVYLRSTASLRIARQLTWPWRAAGALVWIPVPLRDAAYRVVAAIRLRVAGRSSSCAVPPKEIRDRMI